VASDDIYIVILFRKKPYPGRRTCILEYGMKGSSGASEILLNFLGYKFRECGM
jgi:hypothetical protein